MPTQQRSCFPPLRAYGKHSRGCIRNTNKLLFLIFPLALTTDPFRVIGTNNRKEKGWDQ